MEKNNKIDHSNLFFLGLVVGGVLGILFAPEKGETTRKKLREFLKHILENGIDELKNYELKSLPTITRIEPIARKIESLSPPVPPEYPNKTKPQKPKRVPKFFKRALEE